MGRTIFRVGIVGITASLCMLLLGVTVAVIHNDFGIWFYFFGLFILFFSLPIAALGLIIWVCVMPGKRKQIGGFILFLLGLGGFVISYFFFEAGAHSYEDIPQFLDSLFGMLFGSISIICLVAGIILFFIGRSQTKDQKNQYILK
jgi:hypothetical protein